MPSRRSPSQRTAEGRQGRQMSALSIGANAGRMISANRGGSEVISRPASTPSEVGFGGLVLDTVIKQGPAGIATDVFPAGTRIPAACTTTGWFLRCDPSHPPTGSDCTVEVKLGGSTVATVSIAAGNSIGSDTTPVTLAAGDILTYDVTSVGSTTPAYDIACMIVAS